MAITTTKDSVSVVDHVGRVLACRHFTVRVSSDHAWIDSGDRNVADVWMNGRVETVSLSGGYDSTSDVSGTVDASDEFQAHASEYTAFVAWMRLLRMAVNAHENANRKAKEIAIGMHVEAFKGRKVAKGTRWYVRSMGAGDYGPYANLSSQPNGMGEFVRYVNPDNLRPVAPVQPELYFPSSPYGPASADCVAIALQLVSVLEHHWQETERDTLWCVLRDAWEDTGANVPECLTRASLKQD